MKVKSLFIKDYNQFKDFSLDLTYPKGHEKAGQPLDKVCIIGQSGTGKTSILNLILREITEYKLYETFKQKIAFDKAYHEGRMKVVGWTGHRHIYEQNKYLFETFFKQILSQELLVEKAFETQFISSCDIDFSPYSALYYFSCFNFLHFEPKQEFSTIKNNVNIKIFDINDSTQAFWNLLSFKIKNYQEEEIKRKLAISEIQDINTFQEEQNNFNKWVNETENPLKDLAESFLDKILKNFNLKIKQKLEFSSREDIGELKIETLQGIEVPKNILSTGTQQIINTILPIYTDRPKKSIILFDEPERSLYPDIQTQIVDIYSGLAEDCQFFYATHSPIVASSFEPWEIVELKFREDGTVYRELYYDENKENHVDNYFINPQYLRWDSILTKIFDLDMDANPERTKKLMELAKIRSKIKKINGNATSEEKQELMQKFEKLANLLDWEFDEKN